MTVLLYQTQGRNRSVLCIWGSSRSLCPGVRSITCLDTNVRTSYTTGKYLDISVRTSCMTGKFQDISVRTLYTTGKCWGISVRTSYTTSKYPYISARTSYMTGKIPHNSVKDLYITDECLDVSVSGQTYMYFEIHDIRNNFTLLNSLLIPASSR